MLLWVQLFDFKHYSLRKVHKYQPRKWEINFQLFFSDNFKAQRLPRNYLGKVKIIWEGRKISKNPPPVLTKQLFLLSSMPLNSVQFTAKCDNKKASEINLHSMNQKWKNHGQLDGFFLVHVHFIANFWLIAELGCSIDDLTNFLLRARPFLTTDP